MAKPLTCNKYVARGIKKYGLREVQAAVEMAVELSGPDTTPALKRPSKPKLNAKQKGLIEWAEAEQKAESGGTV